jgi:flavin reductase (DIM6/NTAB) family NADH-FMN oxidoreductase RutF
MVSQQEYFSAQANRFSVNVLGSEHEAISNLCAGRQPGVDRFSIGAWSKDHSVPHITDAQAVFFCETDMTISYGTHQIVIAHIKGVNLGSDLVAPLIYADGNYGDFTPKTKG